jgi:hypothetical protein
MTELFSPLTFAFASLSAIVTSVWFASGQVAVLREHSRRLLVLEREGLERTADIAKIAEGLANIQGMLKVLVERLPPARS